MFCSVRRLPAAAEGWRVAPSERSKVTGAAAVNTTSCKCLRRSSWRRRTLKISFYMHQIHFKLCAGMLARAGFHTWKHTHTPDFTSEDVTQNKRSFLPETFISHDCSPMNTHSVSHSCVLHINTFIGISGFANLKTSTATLKTTSIHLLYTGFKPVV